MKNFALTKALLFLCLSIMTSSFAATQEQKEIDELIKVFQSDFWPTQKEACNQLQWSGISDTRLFDIIETNLVAMKPTEISRDKVALDKAAWYAKALGVSGQKKYLPLLEKLQNNAIHKKIKKYGKASIKLLDQYAIWNPIISNRKNFNKNKSLQVNRFSNMLNSDDWTLKQIAIKRINHEKIFDESLFDNIHQQLLSNAKEEINDKIQLKTLYSITKILAASGKATYKEDIKVISSNAKNKKLRTYALKISRKYYGK